VKISLQRIAGTTAILLLMGVCIWVSFNYLVWFLPAQPSTRDIALADRMGTAPWMLFSVGIQWAASVSMTSMADLNQRARD
jgi:hypothetical protein